MNYPVLRTLCRIPLNITKINYYHLYQDILGSAGGFRLNPIVVIKIINNLNFARMVSFFKTQFFYGRIVNAFQRQFNHDIFLPKSTVIEPTFRCNLSCSDCYAPKGSDVMDPDLFESIITQSEELGIFRTVLMGGEPTLQESVDAVLPTIKKHSNTFFTFCTNCTMINENYLKQFKGVNNIAFLLSMEGTKKLTEQRRGKGVYEQYLKAFKLLRKHQIAYAISITIYPDTWSEQAGYEVIENYAKAGGTVIYTYILFDKTTMSQKVVPRVEFLKQLQSIVKKYPLFLVDGQFGKMTKAGIIPRDLTQVCIDVHGNVRPSRFIYKPVYGNLKNKLLKEVLGDKELIKVKFNGRINSANLLNDQVLSLREQGFKVSQFNWKK